MSSNLKRLVLIVCAFVGFSAASSATASPYSRGPYLPQDGDLLLPGLLLVRDGLNERCEDRRFPCDGRSELVLVKLISGFSFGNVRYDCVEIDDGAYGALKCQQIGYTALGFYSACVQLKSAPAAPADLDFRNWYCSK